MCTPRFLRGIRLAGCVSAPAWAILIAAVLSSTQAHAAQIVVPSGASIRAAVAMAVPGDEIVLQAGGVYTESVTLPDKGAGGTITIRASSTLPDRRITPTDRALLPSIGSGTTMAAFIITGSRWRLVGLAFRANSYGEGNVIDVMGSAADIVIDRVLIEGGAQGQKRGVSMNGGGAITVSRSHIANIWKAGQDSQALAAWNGPGPFTIVDNYLEAASENVLFGGADSASEARMPADILVEGNHLTKRLTWKGVSGYVVKNLFELKAARRVTVRNNLFEHNWADGQSGWALLVTPRNQDGNAPWSRIEDVLFERNILRHTTGGINITGRDDLALSGQTRRVTFRHNLFVTDQAWLQAAGEIGELTLDHNTVVNGGTLMKLAIAQIHEAGYTRQSQYAVGTFTILNSLMQHGAQGYGIWGEASGIGSVALEFHTNSYDMRRNVVAGENGWGLPYPTGTLQPAYAEHAANFAVPYYTLVATSAYRAAALDGLDLGAGVGTPSGPAPVPDGEPVPAPLPPPPPPPLEPLPAPWASQDVGLVGFPGSATVAGGIMTLRAAGADVWGNADELHYAWQPVSGDVDVIARVASIEAVHAWTKAGVMIRERLTADSPHAFMLVSPLKGLAFQRRLAQGGLSTSTGVPGAAPAWVKLARRGATITAFQSADGVTWTLVGADTFAMPRDIHVGLALTSHDDTRVATASFDNVVVRPLYLPVAITPPSLPGGRVAEPYSGTLSATGGSGTFVWSRASGTIPPGLALNSATGALSGTPTQAGVFSFIARVVDAANSQNTATAAVTVSIAPPRVAFATSALPDARVGLAYSAYVRAIGGTGVFTWQLASGTLPTGLAFTTTGSITGTPQQAGAFAIVIRVSDASDPTNTATAAFTLSVAAATVSGAAATAWTAGDIGAVGVRGAFAEQLGSFSVRGSGSDVGGTADALQYGWQRVTGDVDIIARITSIEQVHVLTKAGVMIRESLAAGAAQAFMRGSPNKEMAFDRRLATNGTSTSTAGGAGTPPIWVKLERRGNTIKAFRSMDGVWWTLVGTAVFTMGPDVYVGLAVTSHDNSRLATATFSNVLIRRLP